MMASDRKTCTWVVAILACLLLVAGGCTADDDTTYDSEGTITTPIALGATFPLTYSGTVGSTPSYYVATVDAALTYSVLLSGMRYDLDLLVYDTANVFVNPPLCASVTIDIADEACLLVDTTGTELYIKVVSHNSFGSPFTLAVQTP